MNSMKNYLRFKWLRHKLQLLQYSTRPTSCANEVHGQALLLTADSADTNLSYAYGL